MGMRFNREKLKAYLFRRKSNAYGLLVITAMSMLATLFCALTGVSKKKVELLVLVTAALIVLCFIQAWRMRKCFRTLHSFKGTRSRKTNEPRSAN